MDLAREAVYDKGYTLWGDKYKHSTGKWSSRTTQQNCAGDGMDHNVMNQLDPIEELYDMYSEKEDTLRIVEIEDNRLDFLSDVDGPADLYMDL